MGGSNTVLAPQAGPLGHSKAVLLIDDGQAQVMELHRVLDEGMGADEDLQFATHQRLVDLVALLLARRASQKSHLHADGIGEGFDGLQVLPCQNLGRCHDTRLIVVVKGN